MNTREGYEMYGRLYVKPALGSVPVGKVTTKMLEDVYAGLHRCRLRCDGRARVDHRTEEPHECRVARHRRRPGRPPAGGWPPHDCATTGCQVTECPPHVGRPLSPQTVRHVHFAISSTLSAAVRWGWISSNPATVAKKPRQPTPQPSLRPFDPKHPSPRRYATTPTTSSDHWPPTR